VYCAIIIIIVTATVTATVIVIIISSILNEYIAVAALFVYVFLLHILNSTYKPSKFLYIKIENVYLFLFT